MTVRPFVRQTATPADALFAGNTGLIGFILGRRFSALLSDPDRRGDAWTAAALGLWHAARRYDASRGHAFPAYALPCIERTVLRHLKSERAQRRLDADALDLDGGGDADGEAPDPHELIADERAERPGARALSEAGWEALVSGLGGRQREVLERVYRGGETMAEVAAAWGVSRQRVGQTHGRALAALRGRRGRPE